MNSLVLLCAKFYCLWQGTLKRDEQRCREIRNYRLMKFRPLQCKHTQKGVCRGQ